MEIFLCNTLKITKGIIIQKTQQLAQIESQTTQPTSPGNIASQTAPSECR